MAELPKDVHSSRGSVFLCVNGLAHANVASIGFSGRVKPLADLATDWLKPCPFSFPELKFPVDIDSKICNIAKLYIKLYIISYKNQQNQ